MNVITLVWTQKRKRKQQWQNRHFVNNFGKILPKLQRYSILTLAHEMKGTSHLLHTNETSQFY